MNAEAEIKWIAEELTQIKDPSIIQYFKNFLLSLKEDSNSERISIEQYNKEVDEVVAQYRKGDYITHEELEEKVKEW